MRIINTELRLAVISGEREQGMGREAERHLHVYSFLSLIFFPK